MLVYASLATVRIAFAQKPADKPRVPPGVDPGGVAVAIIGSGINYTRSRDRGKRLARDGEGEIIGWDFVDNDQEAVPVLRPTASIRRRMRRHTPEAVLCSRKRR